MMDSSFTDRLNKALDYRQYPPLGKGRINYIQEAFNVSRAGANKWLHNQSIPHRNKRIEIARKLGINLLWLENGSGQMLDLDSSPYDATSNIKKIPFLNLADAIRIGHISDKSTFPTLVVSSDIPSSCFAVEHAGNSMFPKVIEGNILIVDRSAQHEDGDIVLLHVVNQPESIIRQYVVGSAGQYLCAINPKFVPIPLDNNVSIIGKVIEIRAKV